MKLIKEDEKIFWAYRTVKLSWIKYIHENSSIDRKDIWRIWKCAKNDFNK